MTEDLNAMSTVIVALATIGSLLVAFRMYRLEKSRDLQATNFHCWVSKKSSGFGSDSGFITINNLNLAISNRSQLPIYFLQIEVVSKSAIVLPDGSVIPKGEVIYRMSQDFVDDLKTSDVEVIGISPEDVRYAPLANYLNGSHSDSDSHKVIERIASELSVNYQFKDIYNQQWKRFGSSKLKRVRFSRG